MFQRLDGARVIPAPFPHIVLHDVLDGDISAELVRQMPPLTTLTGGAQLGSNARFTLNAATALAAPDVSPLWKQIINEGMSQEFLDRVTRLFGPFIRAEFPDFATRFADPERLVARPRQAPERPLGAVGLDAQISGNTPALTGGTTVRGPHLDRTDKLFVGLLYLRLDGDDSDGGNLELYEAVDPEPTFAPKRLLTRDRVRLVKTVPYRRNTLVLFLNTPRALHGVSPRAATPHPRYFLNLVGEMTGPVFDVRCQSPLPAAPPVPETRGLIRRMWNGLVRRSA
ncbi:hypothetical protein VT84_21035 [Gemmata sp. SH-PL17]|uniref:2OG-Fe(II) oxygenase n=1 Tax=Gemmata sp. SH-PL17 TaxID=1630693 RepID=UPI00078B9A94|nr:2OG-Fe(II) oxygenase [Gemmata sp. SH-PL17]AMV26899.1 hypothetical protein VT84_21035 [Gemmata sp. SH-PL17]